MNHIFKLSPNGTIQYELGWRGAFARFEVTGGPYDAYPGRLDAFGVCVRAERAPPGRYDVHLPIPDFSVPTDTKRVEIALYETFTAALDGHPIYVGCMGGWGRTGLFLALMAKVAGYADPVLYVRENYSEKAVETIAQAKYVENFDVSWVRQHVFQSSWKRRIKVWLGR